MLSYSILLEGTGNAMSLRTGERVHVLLTLVLMGPAVGRGHRLSGGWKAALGYLEAVQEPASTSPPPFTMMEAAAVQRAANFGDDEHLGNIQAASPSACPSSER